MEEMESSDQARSALGQGEGFLPHRKGLGQFWGAKNAEGEGGQNLR